MIQVNIRKLLQRLENEAGYKVSLSELSKTTKIHRNLLSKLNSMPSTNISSRDVDKLLNFAFEKLREKDPDKDVYNKNWELTDQELMKSLLDTLLGVYPENPRFAPHESEEISIGEFQAPIDALWERHEEIHPSHKDFWKKVERPDYPFVAKLRDKNKKGISG